MGIFIVIPSEAEGSDRVFEQFLRLASLAQDDVVGKRSGVI